MHGRLVCSCDGTHVENDMKSHSEQAAKETTEVTKEIRTRALVGKCSRMVNVRGVVLPNRIFIDGIISVFRMMFELENNVLISFLGRLIPEHVRAA